MCMVGWGGGRWHVRGSFAGPGAPKENRCRRECPNRQHQGASHLLLFHIARMHGTSPNHRRPRVQECQSHVAVGIAGVVPSPGVHRITSQKTEGRAGARESSLGHLADL
ncbi:hypothetical protein AAFF_G00033810 [Aldrovandia affinis]|uniref:Uncharacterized protein n=1 Tax=Aldrovandia affinis TaxID=143900 RepID=A0AAD7WFN9_9TELE|nr:hypothetical protein AAFF_G00033810 [Aldrovandia affinis]